ncbi:sulfate permease [Comamonas sp. Y6]|uniref:Sulfate permease n=1 Tax=Comamonas resistens TaxID=3046670 RepID=A0ABY8SQ33_9BURK|nr:sulfate permease [Comamonas resistens]MDL5035763.1 sulfate permease [Comamonas resistens]WHS65177.1 sulfate permease [Comamonas resistens]HBP0979038.1 sulfate permease [Pseudomonas aeruginosa]
MPLQRPHPNAARPRRLQRWFPILSWGRHYHRDQFTGDLLAAGIVKLMLIPQSLAYALLAGLPPQAGLYASMLPLLAYAVLGSSRTLAVGPAAVTSLMTAAAVGQVAASGSVGYWDAALLLALLSGLMLTAMGLLRLGFIANYLSHPVISGFISASGVLIATGQAKHLLGIPASGDTLPELLPALWHGLPQTNGHALAIGLAALAFLWWSRRRLKPLLLHAGIGPRLADALAKAGPVAAIAATTVAVWYWDLATAHGVRVVGEVPQGLPPFTPPTGNPALWTQLAELVVPALLLSVVGFVESISVGQTLAAKRRQRVEPDQELVALGASNVAAAFNGGLPVTGGFSRSVVNFDAGAQTPAAGIYTAAGIAVATLLFTPLLHHLPQATLAATIIVAVLSLVDLDMLRRTWRYSRFDFTVVAATLATTLLAGVEMGLVAGVGLALVLHLYRSSRPHIAVVGQVPGTEHFRNVLRHPVRTGPRVLGLRIDESLYFANARYLEDRINDAVAAQGELRHVVLQCSAINDIDASALESLEAIEARLREADIQLHLSEVKGPVMDRLSRTPFLAHLGGRIHLSHYQAIAELAPDSLA